jgi:hypothetical protein
MYAGRRVYVSELNPSVKGVVTNGKLGIYGGGVPIAPKEALIERIKGAGVFSQAISVADHLKNFSEAEGLKLLVEIGKELYADNIVRIATFKSYLAEILSPEYPSLSEPAMRAIAVLDKLIDGVRGGK